jgi:hypothetical protein
MDPLKDYEDVLQNIEAVVAEIWRKHPEMTNYTVMRAYEAAIARYHAEARGYAPKPANLTGLDAMVFSAVSEICEWRLGRTRNSDDIKAIPVEDLVACLRKLNKSVEFWTQTGGRQGYMTFIERFV